MTALAPIHAPDQDLPGLIERAATMLSGAKTAAEVLEAREAAGLAYDIAKRAPGCKPPNLPMTIWSPPPTGRRPMRWRSKRPPSADWQMNTTRHRRAAR